MRNDSVHMSKTSTSSVMARFLSFVSFALVLAITTGCSAQARKARAEKRADDFFKQGEFSKAEVEYFNVLQLDRTNSHAIRQLALIYDESGRPVRALPFLNKAIEQNPDDPLLRVKLGSIFLSGGATAPARTNALLALDLAPTNDLAPLVLVEASRTPEDIQQARARLNAISRNIGETAPLELALGALLIRERKLEEGEAKVKHALVLDPQSSPAHNILAMLALAKGNTNAALAEFKAAAELSPIRSPRKMQYADFLVRMGQTNEARQVLAEVNKRAPDYVPAWVAHADLELNANNLDEAARLVSVALSRDGESFESILLDSRIKLAAGKVDQAVSRLERLTTLYERSPIAHFYLGNAYLAQNDSTKALAQFNEAVKIMPEFDDAILQQAQLNIRRGEPAAAITALNELVQRRPNLAPAHFLLGAAQVSRGDLNQALATYGRLAQLMPTNAQVPILSGIVLRQQGKRTEARKAFQDAQRLAPKALQPLELLVNLDLAETNYPAALQRIQSQIDANPSVPMLQALLAKVYVAQDKFTNAEQALIKAKQLDPDFLPAYQLLAQVYVKADKHPQALQELQQVLQANPTNGPALLQTALIYDQEKNYTAARDAYEKLLAVAPRASVALNNLAYLYSERFNELDKAYDAARNARELLPYDPSTADTLGWILFKRGDYMRALDLIEEAAEKLPAEPEIAYHLGMSHYMLGHEESARAALKRSIQSEKEFGGKADARQALSVLDINPRTADATAIGTLEKLLGTRPDDPMVLSRLAAIYDREKQFDKALALYEKAVQQNPKNVVATVRLAQIYFNQKHDTAKAMQLAKAARALAPNDGQVSLTLGRLAYDSGEFAYALGLFQEAQRRLGNEPDLLYSLARAQCSVGNVSDAKSTMQQALGASSGFSHAADAQRFLRLASIYQNPDGSAQGLIEETLKSDPDNLLALAGNASLKEKSGDVPGARAAYEGLIQRYPQFTPVIRQLALLYSKPGGDPEKAYSFATKARTAYPDDAEVTRCLGILTYNRKDYSRSAQLLREATTKRPQDAEAFYYLGMAQQQSNRKTEATQSLRQALALNLDPQLAQEANKILNSK